jgi:hypothetical protein
MILVSRITLNVGELMNNKVGRTQNETIIVELGVSSQNLHRGTEEDM